jgi:hypothetical protein
MHGDGLVHSLGCCRAHRVTAGCPVDCLASLLPSRVLGRLARADGRGQVVASCGVPVTVGDVARLYGQGRLGEITGLGPAGIRDIRASLAAHGLAGTDGCDAITADCPVECLGSVLSERVLHRLARADGRGVAVAPGGPPVSVGDVVRRYREGRLGEIAGLGARGISEIEAGLVFAGLLLADRIPLRQSPRARAAAPGLAATAAGTGQSAAAGRHRRRPGTGSG